jgi:hypothetical protein
MLERTLVLFGCTDLGAQLNLPPDLTVKLCLGLASSLFGLLGGLASHILSARSRAKDGIPLPPGWQNGIRGDLVIGCIAGLVAFLYCVGELPIAKIFGLAIAGGVSGGKYLKKDLEVKEARQKIKTEQEISKRLTNGFKKLAAKQGE